MATVNDVLNSKGREVCSVTPDTLVSQAVTLMNEKNIGVLTVVEIEDLVGILSERDCARKMILQKLDISTTKVKDIMTAKVISVDSHKSVEDCLALMNKNRFRHLPVIKEGKLDGLVSAMDLTKSVLAAQEFLIQQLDQYIKQG